MLHRITTPLPANMDPQGGGKPLARIIDWICRLFYILYILASLYIGIFLLCLPFQRFWDNNYMLYLYPQFRPLVANPFFKGFVLGLGIINILIGVREVAHIRGLWKRNYFSR